jgi:hypothetical protein
VQTITTISHAHNQGRDHWKLGSGKDEPPWPGAHNQLAVYPSLALMRITIQYVSSHFPTAFRSTIGTDFITKTLPHHSKPDESVTLQIWVRPRPAPPPRLLSSLPPIAHATVRILPGKNASRPFLPRFSVARMLSSSSSASISLRRCALLTAGGRSFVCAHLSMTTKQRINISWWSGTRPTSCSAQRAVQSQTKLPWTSSTNLSCHRGLHPVAWRHRRTGET